MSEDLNFVTTEELIKVLQTRFDELVFIGAMQSTSQTEDLTISFSGSYHSCVGLIELGKIAIQAGGNSEDEDYA
tara:strand:- start:11172 stop:11393 length:222 start_codon:yes stop_codon:yes gene_type:complete